MRAQKLRDAIYDEMLPSVKYFNRSLSFEVSDFVSYTFASSRLVYILSYLYFFLGYSTIT